MTPEDDARARHLASLAPEVFRAGLRRLDPEEQRRALVLRFRYDRESFARFLWPDVYRRPFAAPHHHILGAEKVSWRDRRDSGTKLLRAVAAPRGFAKTQTTIADLCHDAIYGLEGFVPVISAKLRLARESVRTVRSRVGRDRVRDLYGPIEVVGGKEAFSIRSPLTENWCGFRPYSFGTEVRGESYDDVRPTRVAVDDGEERLRVNKPEYRQECRDFLDADIIKLSDSGGGIIVDWLGTVLHEDAVLAHLIGDPGWDAVKYKALIEEPRREDLWTACGVVWGDLSLASPWFGVAAERVDTEWTPGRKRWAQLKDVEKRREAAYSFYLAHQAEMDDGAEMLASTWISVFDFHVALWAEGRASVLKDYQNTPRDPKTRIYTHKLFPKCRVITLPNGELGIQRLDAHGNPEGRTIPRSDGRVTLRLDPIPGEDMGGLGGGPGGSDYAAIAVLFTDRDGVVYVVDGWMDRVTDSRQMAMFWGLAEKWRAERAKIESNGFQRWMLGGFRRIQEERKAKGQWWQTALADAEDSRSTTNKIEDITALEPVIATRRILFAEGLPKLGMDQFDEFPTGTHDDFPDAVARGYRDARGGGVRMVS